ncbi:hypothetical protein [Mycolicibacterium tusciae]|uniref:hypothetical protein n=1 Tax=Mycolicibacterium tusciae TaxID=75922 RepID=UPI00024A3261|nr:hypothetical protein [Mycolicibacterium tusciae]
MSASAYEAWVTAVRSWRDDPRHDLSALPSLGADSLPPSAYERLFDHIRLAQQRVMDRWSETFARDWGNAREDHARVRALMATRVLLARRLQLAAHPGLPEVVRTEFTNGVARDVHALQKDLEDAAVRQTGHRVDRVQTDRTLNLLRANRLTVILEPGFPLQACVDGRIDPPPPTFPVPQQTVADTPTSDPPRRKYRTIIIGD